jgi:uncharacterized protein YjbI with pentapeptide repeats
LAFIVLVLNEMVLVLVLDSVFSITSTSTASLSTASLSTASLSTAPLSTAPLSTASLSTASLSTASLSTASLSTAPLSGLLARLSLLTSHLRLVFDLGQLDPLER